MRALNAASKRAERGPSLGAAPPDGSVAVTRDGHRVEGGAGPRRAPSG